MSDKEDTYRCIPFKDIKDGQSVLAFGKHASQWDFATMGVPSYAFVPVDPSAGWDPIPANGDLRPTSDIPDKGKGFYATRTRMSDIAVNPFKVDTSYEYAVWFYE